LYGSQRSLLLLLRHLPTDRVRVFVSVARPGPLLPLLAALPQVTILSHRRLGWFKHDARRPLQAVGDSVALVLAAPLRAFALARLIRRHGIDLVHTNSVVSLEGALAAWWCKKPHVWHVRELFVEFNPKLFPVLGRRLSRKLLERLADRVVCISQVVRRQFEPVAQRSQSRFRVIYNAFEPAVSQALQENPLELPPKPGFRLGYIGRLSEGKRFQDLLLALAELERRGIVTIDLLVAGTFVDAAYEAAIQSLLERHHLRHRVHFLGFQEDLEPVFSAVDAVVVPSLNEPFGRVVIEAMAAGRPCIGANAGGIPEILTHERTGLLVPPQDPIALADAIARLMREPELRDACRNNALNDVHSRFGVERYVREVLAVYDELTG
jgi:glycosyltransferase involved in cell wall biosynthesis